MANSCNAINRINRIGNGFNGHRGNYICKAEATMVSTYEIRDAFSYNLLGIESLPTCAKHGADTPAMAARRVMKRAANQAVR